MKLSVYPKVNFLPKNKDDKILQSKLASNPNFPEIAEIDTEESLMDIVTNFGWSPSIFSGFRHNENFVSTDFMSLDIDSGIRIEEAEKRVQNLGLACLCLPSPSHSQESHRFRLIFPLAKTILTCEDFDATWDWLQQQFPELDAQCSDYARWYAPSRMDDGFWQDGDFLVPKKAPQKALNSVFSEVQVEVPEDLKELVKLLYGKDRETIPEAVEFFLTNAHTGLSGSWISSLNAFCFSLSLSGVDESIIWQTVEKLAPLPLDKKDCYQIKKSIRDGISKKIDL